MKLNMLYPGGKMCGASGILLALALALYLCGLQTAARIAAALAGLLFAALLVLVCVELWQDARDNARYIEENRRKGE